VRRDGKASNLPGGGQARENRVNVFGAVETKKNNDTKRKGIGPQSHSPGLRRRAQRTGPRKRPTGCGAWWLTSSLQERKIRGTDAASDEEKKPDSEHGLSCVGRCARASPRARCFRSEGCACRRKAALVGCVAVGSSTTAPTPPTCRAQKKKACERSFSQGRRRGRAGKKKKKNRRSARLTRCASTWPAWPPPCRPTRLARPGCQTPCWRCIRAGACVCF
jgi:hypothetical protein